MNSKQILFNVKSAIRQRYAWPGGYPVYILMSDGELMCPDCARKEYRQIVRATKAGLRDGWKADGTAILWESESMDYCCHCNKELPSAYGND